MGNCQAIDEASLVIQHPNGKLDRQYSPVNASEIMRLNPGYHVALLTTTTNTNISRKNNESENGGANTVRMIRVKLLRPTDALALGHAYRLISTQEVMKGLVAKKQEKMRKHGLELERMEVAVKDSETFARRSQLDIANQVAKQEWRSRVGTTNSGTVRPRTWQPSLHSISEAGS